MAHTYSQLLNTRLLAIEVKDRLSYLWAQLKTCDMVDEEDLIESSKPFESPKVRISDTGLLCDDIIVYCTEQLKILDAKKELLSRKKE